jgi:hypothetical protein
VTLDDTYGELGIRYEDVITIAETGTPRTVAGLKRHEVTASSTAAASMAPADSSPPPREYRAVNVRERPARRA